MSPGVVFRDICYCTYTLGVHKTEVGKVTLKINGDEAFSEEFL
jgi:hypothetical protein